MSMVSGNAKAGEIVQQEPRTPAIRDPVFLQELIPDHRDISLAQGIVPIPTLNLPSRDLMAGEIPQAVRHLLFSRSLFTILLLHKSTAAFMNPCPLPSPSPPRNAKGTHAHHIEWHWTYQAVIFAGLDRQASLTLQTACAWACCPFSVAESTSRIWAWCESSFFKVANLSKHTLIVIWMIS